MNRIEIYSTNNCPWCTRAKSLLRTKGLEYEEIDISADQARALEMIERSGRRTVPQVFIDDEPVGGFNELSKMNLTDKRNQLTSHSKRRNPPMSNANPIFNKLISSAAVLALLLSASTHAGATSTQGAKIDAASVTASVQQTRHKTLTVNGVEVFYREAGPDNAPTILLLHGFPTSSHMFRNLIPALADKYHVVAPDYPGFGNSEQPPMDKFDYSFDNLATLVEAFADQLGIDRYSLYLMDYGAPIGFRLAARHPERVQSLIVQNGNAYNEGLREFWDPIRTYWSDPSAANAEPLAGFISPDGVKWQYTHGVRDAEKISPDNWNVDLRHLTRDGNAEIQLALFYDYQNNVPHYPAWQAYFRKHQPPTLIVWGKNDYIFPAEGAHPYKRDLNNLEFHLLDTGHFALEEDGQLIATRIRNFLQSSVVSR